MFKEARTVVDDRQRYDHDDASPSGSEGRRVRSVLLHGSTHGIVSVHRHQHRQPDRNCMQYHGRRPNVPRDVVVEPIVDNLNTINDVLTYVMDVPVYPINDVLNVTRRKHLTVDRCGYTIQHIGHKIHNPKAENIVSLVFGMRRQDNKKAVLSQGNRVMLQELNFTGVCAQLLFTHKYITMQRPAMTPCSSSLYRSI